VRSREETSAIDVLTLAGGLCIQSLNNNARLACSFLIRGRYLEWYLQAPFAHRLAVDPSFEDGDLRVL
jgi:hypothetical protein